MVRPVCHCGGAHWPMGCSRPPKAPKPTTLQRVRQRIADAREVLARAAASVRLRASDALDDWAFARLLVPDGPTYEEAVARVLEEGNNIEGKRAGVHQAQPSEDSSFKVWAYPVTEAPGFYDDATDAARAFVAIEKEGG